MEGRRALHVLKQQVRELLVPQDHLPDETDLLPQSGFIPNGQNKNIPQRQYAFCYVVEFELGSGTLGLTFYVKMFVFSYLLN